MSPLESVDFLLGIAWLAVVPLFLAAYGGHLAAQTISDTKLRRRAICVFWSLFIVGVGIAAIYQYRIKKLDDARELKAAMADAERQQKLEVAQQHAMEAQVELRAIEKSNGDQIMALEKRLDEVITQSQSTSQTSTAQEIKNELAEFEEGLKKQVSAPQQSVASPRPPAQEPVPVVPAKECRGDDLKDCSDEKLLKWGKPLVEQVQQIETAHMAALKALDDITGSWAGFLFGKDKDSKWLKAYAEAQHSTADQFRDCCAENALIYNAELVARVGGGLQDNEAFEWVQKLLKPVKSKEWKEARSEAGKIISVNGDLNALEGLLNLRMSRSKLSHTNN